MVAFLGSTIGNFEPAARRDFFAALSDSLAPGDALLLGTDLVKDPVRLVAAYDDQAGVTAEFNRNVLRVVNRELDADFVPDSLAHVALGRGARVDRDAPPAEQAQRHAGRLGLDIPSPRARRFVRRSAPILACRRRR